MATENDDANSQVHGGISANTNIRFYGMPFVIVVGLVCNVLSTAVFSSRHMRKVSSAHYFLALSVSDSLTLVADVLKWLDDPRLRLRIVSENVSLCKLTYHLRYSSQLLSAFLVPTVTLERCLLVFRPLKASSTLSVKNARIIIVVETLVALLLGSYGSIIFKIVSFGRNNCLIDFQKHGLVYEYCNLIISKVLGEVLTSVIVAVITGMIVYKLLRSRQQRTDLQQGKTTGSSAAGQDRQLTAMLLLVATFFVLLRAPYTVTWYLSHYRTYVPFLVADASTRNKLDLAQNITYPIYMMNYAINFFLFSISGRRFRQTLRGLFIFKEQTSQWRKSDTSGGSSEVETRQSQI